MKLAFAAISFAACLTHHATALPTEAGLEARDSANPQSISQREINPAAASSFTKAGFNLNITLASASIVPDFNTTQCILTQNCIAFAARTFGTGYTTNSIETIVALRNAFTVNNSSNLHDDANAVPNAYIAATGPLIVYQSQPTALPTGAEANPPPLQTGAAHPGPAAARNSKREVVTHSEDPGYETYGCIYYNSVANDWVCRNSTFAYLMLDHISSVDYDQNNGISVWDIRDPTDPSKEYGSYSHCLSTTAGCNNAQANFYSRFVNPTTEPKVISGFKEGHSDIGV